MAPKPVRSRGVRANDPLAVGESAWEDVSASAPQTRWLRLPSVRNALGLMVGRVVSVCEPGADVVASSDDQLMAWVKAGSLAAFGELYDRYCDRAYRVASSICRGEGDAHEAVREAFVSIWRGRASFGAQTGTAAPWVMVLTRRCALEIADNHRPVAAPRDGESTPPTSRAASKIAEHVAKRVQARDLRSLLAALPDRQREVITLAFYGELTYTQIAAHLDLPAGAVKGRMRMGLQRLRADIQRVAS